MWIVTVFAGLLMLFVANSFYTEHMAKEIPWNASQTARDVSNFHTFAAAAELYMRDHAADPSFRPTGTVVVRWADYPSGGNTVQGVSRARGLPPGLAGVSINPTWRIHINNTDNSYVLCTDMSGGGTVKMSNLPQSPLWNPGITWRQRNLTIPNGVIATNAVPMVTFDVDLVAADVCKCDPTILSGATQCL